jgi:UDP-N-acetyl-D-glucosamine dehydrogenase
LAEALDRRSGRGLKGARILIIGIAYKKNVEDTRESASFTLAELIEERGATVDYFDPFVPVIPPTREHATFEGRRSTEFTAEVIRQYDATLIATDHDAIDYTLLARASKLVIDTRNACGSRGLVGDWIVKS